MTTTICDLPGVRSVENEFPVSLCRDEETGRIVIRAVNEGGYACTEVDLLDLLQCFGLDFDVEEFVASLVARETATSPSTSVIEFGPPMREHRRP
jgi:hypothetical protein